MIKLEKYQFENGLKFIYQRDDSSPIAVVNTLYNVGAKDEDPERTGFAHLFEHLMFGGSVNIPDFDSPLQETGADNNAFTSNDITNYYISIPSQNIETAFWLESDRMLGLDFSQQSLEIQKNVVIEEFKERYLNQPYGDVWMHLRKMAYADHPYSWPTIGKDISHIEQATLEEVKSFFYRFYAPDNAFLVVTANLETEIVYQLVKKWFGNIDKRNIKHATLPDIPLNIKQKRLKIESDVPYDALYMVFNMCGRTHPDFYASDLLSDVLSNGRSSRFYQHLLMKGDLFAEIDAYLTGDFHGGLFVITAILIGGVSMEKAEEAIWNLIDQLINDGISKYELEKVKNKFESSKVFSEISATSRAYLIAMHELAGDANNINYEIEKYRRVTEHEIIRVAKEVLKKENSSVLNYFAIR
ncbi:MAG: pitrilysin family protein [Bacteroidales bacterium]|nr:pitrilysin family protein [Bacteroidales bacterium]